MTPPEELALLEENQRDRVNLLPERLRAIYYERALREGKDPDTYVALNYLVVTGLHHFYLGRPVRGSVNLLVFATGLLLVLWSSSLASVAGITGVGMIVFILCVELLALFRSHEIVRQYNYDRNQQIIQELEQMAPLEQQTLTAAGQQTPRPQADPVPRHISLTKQHQSSP